MSDALFSLLVAAGVLVVFPAFWSGTVWMIGTWWRSIAEAYPARDWPRDGHRVLMQSARIGAASYSGVLTLVAVEEGLYIRPFLLFRVGHPAIFIPWGAVEDVEPAMFFGGRLRLASGHAITIPQKLSEAVSRAAEAHQEATSGDRVGPLAPEADVVERRSPEAETERGGLRDGDRRAGSETGWV